MAVYFHDTLQVGDVLYSIYTNSLFKSLSIAISLLFCPIIVLP